MAAKERILYATTQRHSSIPKIRSLKPMKNKIGSQGSYSTLNSTNKSHLKTLRIKD